MVIRGNVVHRLQDRNPGSSLSVNMFSPSVEARQPSSRCESGSPRHLHPLGTNSRSLLLDVFRWTGTLRRVLGWRRAARNGHTPAVLVFTEESDAYFYIL